MDCRHVYEKAVILHYIVNNPHASCPVAGKIIFCSKRLIDTIPLFSHADLSYSYDHFESSGCRGKLQNNKVICDAMLKFEIEEMRTLNKQSTRAEVIEDFTADINED